MQVQHATCNANTMHADAYGTNLNEEPNTNNRVSNFREHPTQECSTRENVKGAREAECAHLLITFVGCLVHSFDHFDLMNEMNA